MGTQTEPSAKDVVIRKKRRELVEMSKALPIIGFTVAEHVAVLKLHDAHPLPYLSLSELDFLEQLFKKTKLLADQMDKLSKLGS